MIRLVEQRIEDLVDYEKISIAFEVRSRVNLGRLRASNGAEIVEIPVEPWLKDYDSCEDDRPTTLPRRFDMANWLIVSAFEGERRLGGMIVARDTPGCDMLEGRSDLASIFDVRIAEEARGKGVGRALFDYVRRWAKDHGCTELRVETQDVNVGACLFYRAMGCELHLAKENAYPIEIGEAMLIWRVWL